MTTIIKTNFGNFQIKLFRFENNEIGYEVYTEPHGDEIYGQYIGEFDPIIKWNEDMDIIEKEIFISELEDFINDNY